MVRAGWHSGFTLVGIARNARTPACALTPKLGAKTPFAHWRQKLGAKTGC
jgi:hypothetical protein